MGGSTMGRLCADNVVSGEQGGDGSEDVAREGADVVGNMNRVDHWWRHHMHHRPHRQFIGEAADMTLRGEATTAATVYAPFHGRHHMACHG
jgi:hypothetical protein